MKKRLYLIDTSAILTGKPLVFPHATMVTTPAIENELKPGGRDYQRFQLLKEKGLILMQSSKMTQTEIVNAAKLLGEKTRLSPADISLLSLAKELHKQSDYDIIVLSDDYSIQNLAKHLKIPFSSVSQKGITKKFKWTSRCPGCGKQFPEITQICPICGTKTQFSPHKPKITKKP
jgi:UPF0271 protein